MVRSRGIATETSRQGQELTRKHTCVKREEKKKKKKKKRRHFWTLLKFERDR